MTVLLTRISVILAILWPVRNCLLNFESTRIYKTLEKFEALAGVRLVCIIAQGGSARHEACNHDQSASQDALVQQHQEASQDQSASGATAHEQEPSQASRLENIADTDFKLEAEKSSQLPGSVSVSKHCGKPFYESNQVLNQLKH